MTKYYRVIKDTFLWEEGAIIADTANNGYSGEGYKPIEDIWNKLPDQSEYITRELVENNPEWFERVYADSIEKLIFKTKDQLKKAFNSFKK